MSHDLGGAASVSCFGRVLTKVITLAQLPGTLDNASVTDLSLLPFLAVVLTHNSQASWTIFYKTIIFFFDECVNFPTEKMNWHQKCPLNVPEPKVTSSYCLFYPTV